ncbi:UNVERIFIED_CONTAM: hypothetical protein HDU68_008876 [Siphonaria sp. JEL0065]|nr:hypothetical protein HDU68_008876 [Siphonaria sp. JEL0065]
MKGKKHEFEDLQHILFQYQKWGHQVFSKYVFRSFVESTEKLCREKVVKVWKESLLNEERRIARGFYNDDDVLLVQQNNDDMNVEMNDQEAIKNQVPLDQALAAIHDLNNDEEEELERIIREAESQHVAKLQGSTSQTSNSQSKPRKKLVIDQDEDDFETQMMAQLGASTIQKNPIDLRRSTTTVNEDDEDEFNRAIQEAEEYHIQQQQMQGFELDFDFADAMTATTTSSVLGHKTSVENSVMEGVKPVEVAPVAIRAAASLSSTSAESIAVVVSESRVSSTNSGEGIPTQAELEALVEDFDWDGDDM